MPDPTPAQIAYEAWVRSKENRMPETRTPGQIAYEAYCGCLDSTWTKPAWLQLDPAVQRAWEAAAQAVLAWRDEGVDGTGFAPPGTYRKAEPHA